MNVTSRMLRTSTSSNDA